MSKIIFAFFFILISSSFKNVTSNQKLVSIYEELVGASKPDFELFEKAYLGYIDLKLSGFLSNEKDILTLIDFRLHANKKRLWMIDLKTKTVLYNTLVAHGENSGKEYALNFSNEINSHKSSLGFYLTEETYIGKNGLSLRLKGLERGFNSNARERYIVMHGADYATKEYIAQNGLLGTSEGCPAIPIEYYQNMIEIAKEGTVLFIYFPDSNYIEQSEYLMSY